MNQPEIIKEFATNVALWTLVYLGVSVVSYFICKTMESIFYDEQLDDYPLDSSEVGLVLLSPLILLIYVILTSIN